MREIKFRAWDKEAKKMFYDGFVIAQCSDKAIFFWMDFLCGDKALRQSETIKNELKQRYDIDSPAVIDFADWSFERMILMQYAGLRDKNGKEIYEGDIVTGSSLKDWRAGNGERAIIEWDNTRSRWDMVFYSIYGGEGHLCKEEIFQDRAKFYEVIGNIYENGSLLDGK